MKPSTPPTSASPARIVRAADSFLSELSWSDLQRLRAAVKRALFNSAMKKFRGKPMTMKQKNRLERMLAPDQLDRIIEARGREVTEKWLKAKIDAKFGDVSFGDMGHDDDKRTSITVTKP